MSGLMGLIAKPFSLAGRASRTLLTGKMTIGSRGMNKWAKLADPKKAATSTKTITLPMAARLGLGAASGAAMGGIAGAAGGYDFNSRIEGAAKGALLGSVIGAGVAGALPAASKTGRWLTNAKGFETRATIRQRMKAPIGPKQQIPGIKEPQFHTKMPVKWGKQASLTEQLKNTPVARAGSAAIGAAPGAVRGVGRTLEFMSKHSGLMLAGAGAAIGSATLYGAANKRHLQTLESPTMEGAKMTSSYNQRAIAAAEIGQIGGGTIGTAEQMQGQFEYANWMQQVGSMATDSGAGRLAQSADGLVQNLHAGRHSGS